MIKNNTNNEQTKDKPFNYLEVLMRQASIEHEAHEDFVKQLNSIKASKEE